MILTFIYLSVCLFMYREFELKGILTQIKFLVRTLAGYVCINEGKPHLQVFCFFFIYFELINV